MADEELVLASAAHNVFRCYPGIGAHIVGVLSALPVVLVMMIVLMLIPVIITLLATAVLPYRLHLVILSTVVICTELLYTIPKYFRTLHTTEPARNSGLYDDVVSSARRAGVVRGVRERVRV